MFTIKQAGGVVMLVLVGVVVVRVVRSGGVVARSWWEDEVVVGVVWRLVVAAAWLAASAASAVARLSMESLRGCLCLEKPILLPRLGPADWLDLPVLSMLLMAWRLAEWRRAAALAAWLVWLVGWAEVEESAR